MKRLRDLLQSIARLNCCKMMPCCMHIQIDMSTPMWCLLQYLPGQLTGLSKKSVTTTCSAGVSACVLCGVEKFHWPCNGPYLISHTLQ